jgi:hypothetical protein
MNSKEFESFVETVGKAIVDAEAANAARWRKLAEQFLGQVPTTPAEFVDFFASEYHWSLDHIAGLDSFQKYHFVKAALERRKGTRRRSGPRNKNSDLLEFADRHHHLSDKEILAKFKKKLPNHSIFEASNPAAALRAARARRRK